MKDIFKITFILLLMCFFLVSCSSASLEITDSWARPAKTGENSAAYFTIQNQSLSKDKLLSASSEIAESVEIHKTMAMPSGNENSTEPMQMVPQDSVDIGVFSSVKFEPGGLHIMFIKLYQDLNIGDNFELTLNFEKAGEIVIVVPVKQP